jgi:C_GCAxxG_C_C family probable redox protein
LEARNLAGNRYKHGYNCAESVLLCFHQLVGEEVVPLQLVRAGTGFGGGLGRAGCLCGPLAAGTMVVGLLRGRTSPNQDREEPYALTRKFHDTFVGEFGSPCCRDLNKFPSHTKEHLLSCLKITGKTSALLMRFLLEQGLVREDQLSDAGRQPA